MEWEGLMPKATEIIDMHEFIVDRHVKNFMLAYRSKGKIAAGLLIKEFPEQHKAAIVKRITTELNI